MFLFKLLVKSAALLVSVFCFSVLFQYGAAGFVGGAKSEAAWLLSLLQGTEKTGNIGDR